MSKQHHAFSLESAWPTFDVPGVSSAAEPTQCRRLGAGKVISLRSQIARHAASQQVSARRDPAQKTTAIPTPEPPLNGVGRTRSEHRIAAGRAVDDGDNQA
jgi:hypothetical protein